MDASTRRGRAVDVGLFAIGHLNSSVRVNVLGNSNTSIGGDASLVVPAALRAGSHLQSRGGPEVTTSANIPVCTNSTCGMNASSRRGRAVDVGLVGIGHLNSSVGVNVLGNSNTSIGGDASLVVPAALRAGSHLQSRGSLQVARSNNVLIRSNSSIRVNASSRRGCAVQICLLGIGHLNSSLVVQVTLNAHTSLSDNAALTVVATVCAGVHVDSSSGLHVTTRDEVPICTNSTLGVDASRRRGRAVDVGLFGIGHLNSPAAVNVLVNAKTSFSGYAARGWPVAVRL